MKKRLLLALLTFLLIKPYVKALSSDQGSYWLLSDQGIEVRIYKDDLHVEVQKSSGTVWIMDTSQNYDIQINGNNRAFSSDRTYSVNGNNGLRVTINEQGATLDLYFLIDSQDLVIEVNPNYDPNKIITGSRYPRPFSADHDSYVYPHGQGGLIDAGRLINDEDEIYANNGISMPWWGVLKHTQAQYKGEGYIAIIEDPYDAYFWTQSGKGISPLWNPSLGSLRYPRSVRYTFYESDADYIVMAKKYRQYRIDKGDFKTLNQKSNTNPNLNRLRGSLLGRPWVCYEGDHWPVEKVCEEDEYGEADPNQQCVIRTFSEIGEYVDNFHNKMPSHLKAVVTLKGAGWHGYNRWVPYQLYNVCEFTGPGRVGGSVRYVGEGYASAAEAWRALAQKAHNYGYLIGPMDNAVMFHHDTQLYDDNCRGSANYGNPDCPCEWDSSMTNCGNCNGWQGGASGCLCGARSKKYIQENYDRLTNYFGIPISFAYMDQVSGGRFVQECYFRDDPVSREEAAIGYKDMFAYLHDKDIVSQSEFESDWAFPELDAVWDIDECGAVGCKPIPLFALVYHDVVVVYSEYRSNNNEHNMFGFLWGLSGNDRAGWDYSTWQGDYETYAADLAKIHAIAGFDEMISHEFLGNGWERTVFSPSGVQIEAKPSTGECVVRGVPDLDFCDSSSCTCSNWQNQGCGAGDCNIDQMHQTRTCNPDGCSIETQCISHSSCAQTCSQLSGDICNIDETCTGAWLTASDTGRCCSVACTESSYLEGDVNKDGYVDLADLVIIAQNYEKTDYDPIADLNGDESVNLLDLVIVAKNYTG